MTVTHFNREERVGNYTFEQLFSAIRAELGKNIEIENLNLPKNLGKISAILWAKSHERIINHITGDVNFLALGLNGQNTILTVHDLGHYTNTLKGWKKWFYYWLWLKLPFNKVAIISTISEFTKEQIISKVGIPEEKIHIIPNPILPGFSLNKKNFNAIKPTILQIGSGVNKNLESLIEAVKGLNVRLLLVNHLYNNRLKEKLLNYNIEFEQRTNLNFNELRKAYIDSDLLFFASEYEGFGMPIIEAQATGRPVITSNIASMPEVAGRKGAVFVNPYSIIEIRTAITNLIQDETLRESCIQHGLENVKKYDIKKIAQQYLELYKKIVPK